MQHTVTQKILDRYGFIPCGMKFSAMGTDQLADEELRSRNIRLHRAFSVNNFDRDTEHTLYLPEECSSFVLDKFDRLQMKYRIGNGRTARDTRSGFACQVNSADKTIDIMVNSIGADFEKGMEGLLKEKESDLINTILVYLNMNDPPCF